MKTGEFNIQGVLEGREQPSFMQLPLQSLNPQTPHPGGKHARLWWD